MSAGVYTSDTHDKSSRLKCEAVVSLCNLGDCCFWILLTVFLLRLWLMGLHFQGFRWRKPVISRSCCQSEVLLRCFALTCLLGGGGGGILNAGGFLGQKSVRATDMLIVFVEKSSLSISFIIFFHELHRFFQLLREVKLPIPPLLWVLSFAELIKNCWKCSCKSFPSSPSFISRCTVTWTRFLFLQNF